jgi:hypothetical protein
LDGLSIASLKAGWRPCQPIKNGRGQNSIVKKIFHRFDFTIFMNSDITKCEGGGCPIKNLCVRYTNPPSEYQSYFTKPPGAIENNIFNCDMFWGENKTATSWLVERLNQCEPWYSGLNDTLAEYINSLIEQAKIMERIQHGQTWDMALKQMVERGYVWQRATCDFDEYWENRNTPNYGGVSQPELPEGGN